MIVEYAMKVTEFDLFLLESFDFDDQVLIYSFDFTLLAFWALMKFRFY